MKTFVAAVLFMLAGAAMFVYGVVLQSHSRVPGAPPGPPEPGELLAYGGLASLAIGFVLLVFVAVRPIWRRPTQFRVVLLLLLGMAMSTVGVPPTSSAGGPLFAFLLVAGLVVMGLAAILGVRGTIAYFRRPGPTPINQIR